MITEMKHTERFGIKWPRRKLEVKKLSEVYKSGNNNRRKDDTNKVDILI